MKIMMDIERAKEMKNSLLWAGIVEELDLRIHCESQKFRTCKAEDLKLIQARIGIFEEVKRIPDDVIDRQS